MIYAYVIQRWQEDLRTWQLMPAREPLYFDEGEARLQMAQMFGSVPHYMRSRYRLLRVSLPSEVIKDTGG